MLKRVKIQGYKSLVDVEVDLQPLSVLFGPNASGKSNFLDALQLLSRIATSNNLNDAFRPPYRGRPLESFTFGPNGIQGLLAQESASFSIEVDVELAQSIVDAVNNQLQALEKVPDERYLFGKYWRYRIEIESIPKKGILSIIDEYLVKLDTYSNPTKQKTWMGRDRSRLNREGGSAQFDPPQNRSMLSLPYYLPGSDFAHLLGMRQELEGWFFYYLEPRERMRIPSPVREVRHIGLMGEELDAFLYTLKVIDEPQFRAMEKALHMIIPSITGIDVNINNLGEIELSLMEGQKPISVRGVSEGTLRILGLLALSSAKERPALLGLEEPENGVHPRRIRLIASFLETRARRNTQVIATTHSPTLIDLIPHESLYVCRKLNGQTLIEPFSNWEYPDVSKVLDEGEEDLPELTVSERILRGDFDV